MCEFKHRHRLWNEPQREQRFKREKRLCEEHTRRKREIAAGVIDWLEEELERDREEARLHAESFLNWYDYEEWRERHEERYYDASDFDSEGSCYSDDDFYYDEIAPMTLEELKREYF